MVSKEATAEAQKAAYDNMAPQAKATAEAQKPVAKDNSTELTAEAQKAANDNVEPRPKATAEAGQGQLD